MRIGDRRVGDRRKESRVPVSRKATLRYQSQEYPCLIQDMSTRGFFIICNKPFLPRQILQLRCELYDAQTLECTIEIKHVDDMGMGTMITDITEKARALCLRFLQDHYSDKLHSLDVRTTR
ncbi:MAG TPA: PilZ domain-containing protein [Burkholderiales bacterium]|nr:PilZ domain-containing protein [Burkholderiales bacterium]